MTILSRITCLSLVVLGLAAAQNAPEIATVTVLDYPFDFDLAEELGFEAPPAVAQGSIFKIWGLGIGPDPGVGLESAEAPVELAGFRVEVSSADEPVREAPLYWVGAGQINAIMPSNVPVGSARIQVFFEGLQSERFAVRIIRSRPRILDWRDGEPPTRQVVALPVVQVASEDGSRRLVTQVEPARPGDMLVLWTTGLGPRTEATDDQAQPEQLDVPLTVYFGDLAIEPEWVGRSGCCAAVDQVQFRLPEDVPLGCSVPLTLRTYDGIVSELERLPITSDGESCERNGTSGASGIGSIQMSREVSDEGILDRFHASFLSGRPDSVEEGAAGLCSPGTVFGRIASLLRSGAPLQVQGPIEDFIVERGEFGFIRSSSEPFLGAGRYLVSAPEGADVGAFSATLEVPEPPAAVRDDLPEESTPETSLTVSWEGNAPVDYVWIRDRVRFSFSDGFARTDGERIGGFSAVCRPTPGETSLTVPEWVMRGLTWAPVDGAVGDGDSVRNDVSVSLISSTESPFEAVGLDVATISYRHEEEIAIPYAGPFLPVTPATTATGETVLAELAVSSSEFTRGLGGRRSLAAGRAFLAQIPALMNPSFPTDDLPSDLDLVWLDDSRMILSVQPISQCPADCAPAIGPAEAHWALALPAGEAARLGLEGGSSLDW